MEMMDVGIEGDVEKMDVRIGDVEMGDGGFEGDVKMWLGEWKEA